MRFAPVQRYLHSESVLQIALDERRARFLPNFYNRPTDEEAHLGVQHGEMPKSTVAALAWQYGVEVEESFKSARQLEQEEHERRFTYIAKGTQQTETDVLEVWFAGCHCGKPSPYRHSDFPPSCSVRRRRRICPKQHAPQPCPYPVAMDDPSVLPHQHRYTLPHRPSPHGRTGSCDALPRSSHPSACCPKLELD